VNSHICCLRINCVASFYNTFYGHNSLLKKFSFFELYKSQYAKIITSFNQKRFFTDCSGLKKVLNQLKTNESASESSLKSAKLVIKLNCVLFGPWYWLFWIILLRAGSSEQKNKIRNVTLMMLPLNSVQN
jgi:hypothetical protein